MRILLPVFLLIVYSGASAQFHISGTVLDEKQKTVKQASVLLLNQNDSVLIISLLSDISGGYVFNTVQPGKYLICISLLGYAKTFLPVEINSADIQLGNTKLEPDYESLEEVTVTARKPFLEQKMDKLVVNVEGSATAAGASALDILRKVPGVLVINEKVTMIGKGTPSIMINGRLSQYMDISQLLRTVNAADIDKIELISNPGAKYDAAGGAIINIVLKKNANLGTNGTVGLTAGTGFYDQVDGYKNNNFSRIVPNFSINHREGKLNMYGSYEFLHRNEYEYNEVTRLIAPSSFFQTNYAPNDELNHTYRAGIDLFADKKNTFGLEFHGFVKTETEKALNNTNQFDATTSQLLSSFQTFNNTANHQTSATGSFNWKHSFDTLGKELNFDADYSGYKLNTGNDITTLLTNGNKGLSNQQVHNPLHFLVLKADYTMPIKKNDKLELGAKSSFSTIDNYLVFQRNGVIDNTRSTDFAYKENINALYASYQKDFPNWKIQAGLRTEQTIATGTSASQQVLNRNYWQLFPSLFVTRKITKEFSAILQYSRRVNRPEYEQQNPFVEYLDSLTYEKGNPLLRPETADEYKLTFSYENEPLFSVGYNKKHDVIVENAPTQVGNFTYTSPQNLASFDNVTFELNFPLEFGKRITGGGGAQAIYNHYKADYLGGTYDRSKWNWLAYWQVAYKLRPTWSFEVSGFYTSSLLNEFIEVNGFGSLNCALQHFMWNRKAKISLNLNDVLFSQKTNSSLNYQDMDVRLRQWEENRNLRLSFTYSFGNQKLKAARNRNKASEEEADRVKAK